MVHVSLKHNFKEVRREVDRRWAKQIPFASAHALTLTAKEIKDRMPTRLRKDLDRPTPFSQRAFVMYRASKRKLEAGVFIKTVQWSYLKFAVLGGIRRPNRKRIAIPGRSVPRNAYGNARGRNWVKTQKNLKSTFSADLKGTEGVWKNKRGGGYQLRVLYVRLARYRRRFKYHETGRAIARATFRKHWNTAIARAIKTAR